MCRTVIRSRNHGPVGQSWCWRVLAGPQQLECSVASDSQGFLRRKNKRVGDVRIHGIGGLRKAHWPGGPLLHNTDEWEPIAAWRCWAGADDLEKWMEGTEARHHFRQLGNYVPETHDREWMGWEGDLVPFELVGT